MIEYDVAHEPASEDPLWWFQYAACKDIPNFTFKRGPSTDQLRTCANCIAQNVCFWYSLQGSISESYYYGVFGGYPPEEREKFVNTYLVSTTQAQAEYKRERNRLWLYVTQQL